MGWLDRFLEHLAEKDRRDAEARRAWLETPEGRRQDALWAEEENRYGYR